MRILLWGEEEEKEGATALRAVERTLSGRFGDDAVRRAADRSVPDAVVVALGADKAVDAACGLTAALQRSRSAPAPLFVLLLKGPFRTPSGLSDDDRQALVEAPAVTADELMQVLEFVAEADSFPRLPVRAKPVRRPSDSPTLVRRVRRNLAKRDPILIKLATSSLALGLALLLTLGWGAASLFLFVGTVSFLISKRSD